MGRLKRLVHNRAQLGVESPEVELDSLSAELRDVVRETVQPAHLSLWLRGAER